VAGADASLAAQAAALERARALAAANGDAQEAERSAAAARWVATAREALARGDVYQARIALGRAQALAASGAGSTGAAPAP
jgi:SWI/SNF-related matrix-associated actin-dependent regulator 1 of chromatin subfamily A